ncbi:unnamed protein product [Vicia faba]|uniref:Uncharacterized protein n=1 Tax=Vicia faba TaxID=3906 RepID=A0AAV0ZZR3_VICFA|nr:unnamed protein product [Vicia faba]
MPLEVFGHELQFAQDPNSKHHGTTVWDASLVFAKFLLLCLVYLYFIIMYQLVPYSTNQEEVLPLLQRNVDRNTSRVMQKNPESFGSIKVSVLQWGDESHIKDVDPPFDYIIGTDVVYAEHLLEPLLQTILALSGPRTTIVLGYEIRSTSVHEKMLQMWKKHFDVKTVSKSKMDETLASDCHDDKDQECRSARSFPVILWNGLISKNWSLYVGCVTM